MAKRSLIPFGNPLRVRRKNLYKKSRFGFKSLTKYLTYLSLGLVLVVAILFAWYSKDLPTPGKIASRSIAQSTKIYDRNGNLLYETGAQKRTLVESNQISDYLKEATVATEDKDFYHHHGIDFRGVFRAAYNDIFHHGTSNTQGGSTITQQFVKSALLDSQQTFSRKIKELILSLEIEQMYNKDQILTMYLNQIPYGSNAAGAEAAAQMYYGVSAKDLSLAQAATLTAIPRSPTHYSPYGTHTDDLIARRNYVLDQMVDVGSIKKADADAAKKVDTTTVNTSFDQTKVGVRPRKDSIKAPHFSMYVLDQLAEKYGDDKINKEGLNVITTLDPNDQALAEKAVTDGAATNKKRFNANNAALVSIDPKTGQILAMVGSKDYFDTSIDGNVNIATSNRQPGSSFKPIVYATAFKKPENNPARVLFDVSTDFGGGWTPQNYNGKTNGPVTMRFALGNSLNIPAVKTLALAGIPESIQTAHDLGITTLNQPASYYGLSLVLGTGEVKLLDMTSAYSVFANGGTRHPDNPFLKITDNNGKLLYQYNPDDDKGTAALDPQIAYEISSILSDNPNRTPIFGANSALYFPGKTVAAKTGTTSDFKDGWTMGYTPNITTGVWVGNNDGTVMNKGEAVIAAGPIFHQYMAAILANQPDQPFTRPSGIVDATVDKYSNKLPSPSSGEQITDIFASWQVPKVQDDVHVSVRVCKSNGLLADDSIPDNLAEFRSYINIHSEFPDKPNWEGPVRAWAEAAGLNVPPPTDKCTLNNIVPKVSITSPGKGASVSGSFNISASASSDYGVKDVEFFIDNISVGKTTDNYQVTYDASSLSTGQHHLSAVVTDNNGSTAKDEFDFTVVKNQAAISNVMAVNLSPTQTKITWQTDTATSSRVDFGVNAGTYTLNASDSAQTTTHSLILTVIHATKYYYKVSGTDGNGQTTNSNEFSFTSQ
jgi:penicillin-binding protein 1C